MCQTGATHSGTTQQGTKRGKIRRDTTLDLNLADAATPKRIVNEQRKLPGGETGHRSNGQSNNRVDRSVVNRNLGAQSAPAQSPQPPKIAEPLTLPAAPLTRKEAFKGTDKLGSVKNLSSRSGQLQSDRPAGTLAARVNVENAIFTIFRIAHADIAAARNPKAPAVVQRLMRLVWNTRVSEQEAQMDETKSRVMGGLQGLFGDDFKKLDIPDFLKQS